MIKTIATFLLVLIAWVAQGQCDTIEHQLTTDEAQIMIQQKKYNQAFDLLLGAKGKTCDSLNRVIDEQVAGLYTQMQKQETNVALTSNWFSEHDSFIKPRLSFAQGKYFFVNKAGKRIKKLGEWKTAMRFDENYYALVKNQKGARYYLDSLGNTYRVAFSPQELSPDITALDLSDYEKYKRAQVIFNQSQLKILIFGVGGVPFLPKEIGKLSNLEVLQVYFSKFIRGGARLKNTPQIPPEIGQLRKLRALNIDGYFEYIPVEVEQLTQLEHLNIWCTFGFMGLPIRAEYLTKLNRLKSLELVGSYEEILPQIGQLTQLRCLRLTGHYTKIPPELSQLTQLESLCLQGNFTQIPTQLIQHAPLTRLWLIGNFTQIPAELGQLTQLDNLTLGGRYAQVPAEINRLRQLRHLRLFGKFTQLPLINKLQKLRKLDITGNFNDEIITPLAQLKALDMLDIYGMKGEISKSIGLLKTITKLYINGNFTKISPAIGQLTQLHYLQLRGKFAQVPPAIGQLSNLIDLDLQGKFTQLPTSLDKLKKLKELSITGEFKVLPPIVTQLKTLTDLFLVECNELTSLPASIKHLQNLRFLCVMYCEKRLELPKEIAQLKKLKKIMGDNLGTFPPEIQRLVNQRQLVITDRY